MVASNVARLVLAGVTILSGAGGTDVAAQGITTVLVDPDVTVGAGASMTAAVGEAVARAEDAVVPARLFTERGVPRRAANITYRFLKLALFDLPQEQFLLVANHEVFGHGGRLRELFNGPIGYRIDPPAPYGRGGGATSFDFDREPNAAELLAVSAGGMEANAVAAALTSQAAFERGELRVRDAIRYLGFELDAFSYIWSTGDEPEEPGHDVSDFLETYNTLIAADGKATLMTARTLRRESLAILANPVIPVALFGIARYLANGTQITRVPALAIRQVRIMPAATYRLAPFGTEWAVTTHLATAERSASVYVAVGRAPGRTPWRIGVHPRRIAIWRGWHVGAGIDAWRQPPLSDAEPPILASSLGFGAMIRGRVERPLIPLWYSRTWAAVVVEVGGKSGGFVPGEPLRGGAVIRGGVTLPLGR